MKQIFGALLVIAVIGLVLVAGCTSTAPQTSPATSSGGTGAQQATTIATTAPVNAATTAVSAGRVIINEKINLPSTTAKKYVLEDYGFQYIYPKDSFTISIDSDKPVNVLVIDKGDDLKFPVVTPAWNTDLRKDQWDYSPVIPVFSQSNVLKKDMTFTIKEKSKYIIIIDPRYNGSNDEVHFNIKVTKN
ncbi:MAG: hypothetical protein OS112_02170 [Methanoregula sp.]|nr:MAG: hypothetical protein OS112_02170 [Methanoregula sp.]